MRSLTKAMKHRKLIPAVSLLVLSSFLLLLPSLSLSGTILNAKTPIAFTEGALSNVFFTTNPPSPFLGGQLVTFTASTPGNGTAPFTYSWNFGDGPTLGSGQIVTHSYTVGCAAPQSFTVTLTVTDSAIPANSQIYMHAVIAKAVDFSFTPTAPTSSYSYFSHNQVFNLTAMVVIACVTPYIYTWNFGDGSMGSGRTLLHSYNVGFHTATFSVTLNLTDSATPTRNKIIVTNAETVKGINAQVGIDCGIGTTQVVSNSSAYPVANSENGNFQLLNQCTWIGDVGQTATTTYDRTTEPLVTDQDEIYAPGTVNCTPAPPSVDCTKIGGGFTANIVLLQNGTSTSNLDAFDLSVSWNPSVLHAVEFDQGGLPWTTLSGAAPFNVVSTIDNVAGLARLAQLITGSPSGLNLTLFRIRFDVIGVGLTQLTVSDSAGSPCGICNPGIVAHVNSAGSFDSESFFDPTHTLNWAASIGISPNPLVPGSPITFTSTATCSGCTAPLSYSWQFDSNSSHVFASEATGNPATITLPSATVNGFRVELLIKDSAPTPHNVTLVVRLPLTAPIIQGPTSVAVGAQGQWTGLWIGGFPSYTATWRFCPGTAAITTVCTNPHPQSTQSGQILTQTLGSYKFAGVYNDTLSLADVGSPTLRPTASVVNFFLVNVTGTPKAFTVTVSQSTSVPTPGQSVTITANLAYNSQYPAFQSTQFSYKFLFGDGTSKTATFGTTATTTHTYSTAGNYTVTVIAQETSGIAVSKIQETGFSSSISVGPALSGTLTVSSPSVQTGQSVTFTATATGGSGTYTSYSWNFGDSSTGTGSSVTHSYSNSGTYNVTLTVTDNAGRTFVTSQTVSVSSSPVSSLLLYVGIGIAVVAAVAAILFLLRRRRMAQSLPPLGSPPP